MTTGRTISHVAYASPAVSQMDSAEICVPASLRVVEYCAQVYDINAEKSGSK